MAEIWDEINEIPPDDIFDYYVRSDKYQKRAVSGILESEDIKFLVGIMDSKALAEVLKKGKQSVGERVGFGLYKCDEASLPLLIANALGPFHSGKPSVKASCSMAICAWIAKGGEPFLKEIVHRTQEIIHGV